MEEVLSNDAYMTWGEFKDYVDSLLDEDMVIDYIDVSWPLKEDFEEKRISVEIGDNTFAVC